MHGACVDVNVAVYRATGKPCRLAPSGGQGRAQDFRFGYSEFPKDKFLA
jgi:hypothetical protein